MGLSVLELFVGLGFGHLIKYERMRIPCFLNYYIFILIINSKHTFVYTVSLTKAENHQYFESFLSTIRTILCLIDFKTAFFICLSYVRQSITPHLEM